MDVVKSEKPEKSPAELVVGAAVVVAGATEVLVTGAKGLKS